MAYKFSLYLPTDAGINYAQILEVVNNGGTPGALISAGQYPPLGAGTPAKSYDNTSAIFMVVTYFNDPSVSIANYRWVVNVDGNVSYLQDVQLTYVPTGRESWVQVRVEMITSPQPPSGGDGSVYIHDGTRFNKYAVYIHDGISFKKAIPYAWNGSWKKGV